MPIIRDYATVAFGQMHVRRAGDGPPAILLHQSPESSAALIPLIDKVAERNAVVAPDMPGYGQSDALPGTPEVIQFADAIAQCMTALGIDKAAVYGVHTGAAVAAALAHQHPHRVSIAVLDGLPFWTDDEQRDLLRHYLPEIEPRIDGGHLTWTWWRVLQQSAYFPWYDTRAEARTDLPYPDAQATHARVLDMLTASAGGGYPAGYAAAFRFVAEPVVQHLSVPTVLLYRREDVLAPHSLRVPHVRPACVRVETIDADQMPARTAQLLAGGAAATDVVTALPSTRTQEDPDP